MNFILGALAVMVMVFTLEASIHVIHYYKASLGKTDPLGEFVYPIKVGVGPRIPPAIQWRTPTCFRERKDFGKH